MKFGNKNPKISRNGKFIPLFLVLCAFVNFSCGQINFANPVETLNQFTSDKEPGDMTSKFIGKAVDSGWKIDTITTAKNIKVINGYFFMDDKHGWLIGAFSTLYKTVDSGKEWKKIEVAIPEDASISNLIFVNENDGWMIARKYNVLEDEDNQFWIFKTNDGGEKWKFTHTEKSAYFNDINFANQNVGYITGYKYMTSSSFAEGLLLKTQNGGETWIDISAGFNALKASEEKKSQMKYGNDFAGHILFITPDHIKMITHSRRVLETTDGGKTWVKTNQYAHDDSQVGIKNFGYKDDKTEWLLESTYSIEGIRARLKTRDSKNRLRRWVIGGVYFTSAFYLSGSSFIASGTTGNLIKNEDKGVIWQTNDDGKTWSEIYSDPKIKGIGGLVEVSKNSYWAMCDDRTILHLYRENKR